jgi:SHS2 domain-containing protein
MASVKILDHLSDLKMEIQAESLEKLYEEALKAVSDLMAEVSSLAKESRSREVVRWGRLGPSEDLIEFLSEALSLMHLKKAVCFVEWIRFGEDCHEASLEFIRTDGFKMDVKAVTYHEALVEELEKGGWRSVLILDI